MSTQKEYFDIAVVGAGPAALSMISAYTRHATKKTRIVVIDEAPQPGGRVWASGMTAPSKEATRLLRSLSPSKLVQTQWWSASRVVAANARELLVESGLGDTSVAHTIRFDKLVLATGARELLLPFQGWTLPGVVGIGALQLMAKTGVRFDRKRVVLAGSGPLLLAAAATLRKAGATVIRISEAQPTSRLHTFARSLWRFPDRLIQAAALRAVTLGTPYKFSESIVAATGVEWVSEVRLRQADGKELEIAVDYLGAAYGLIPNIELAALLGCALEERFGTHTNVLVDNECQTSVPHIYAIGEANGVGGMKKAIADGELVGNIFAQAPSKVVAKSFRARTRELMYAESLAHAFDTTALNLGNAMKDGTLVCRCENVSWGALKEHDNWRDFRLMERCGMGFCQGRVCEGALTILKGVHRKDWRAPIYPCRVDTLVKI